MDTTGILGLPLIAGEQALKHITHNEAIDMLDSLVQAGAISRSETEPPASPSEGDRYIVAASATGDWAGHDHELARSLDGAWAFFAPVEGWLVWVADEEALVTWNGAAWQAITGSAVAPSQLGINATADATNRLAVGADAALFTHDGDDHRLKINKAAAGDTGSVLFQTGFSGRAEFGLAGEDDFSVKVSADGSGWTEALRIDAASGRVAMPATPWREVLTANRTYHVDASAGSDSNDGLSSGAGAFATIQKAFDTICGLDLGGNDAIISVADGTYGAGLDINKPWLGGNITLTGSTSAILSITGIAIQSSADFIGVFQIIGMKLVGSTRNIYHQTNGLIQYTGTEFGASSFEHILATGPGAKVVCNGNYTISGGGSRHWNALYGGHITCSNRTITVTGTPNFTAAFANVAATGTMLINGNSFSGAATGTRYAAATNGVIVTFGGGATYLPGDASGAAATGGVYV